MKSPGNPRGHNNAGNAYGEIGREDLAFLEYEIALKLNPSFSDAHNNLAVLYKKRGLLNEAINEYISAIKHSSNIIYKKIIYKNLGTAFAEKGLVDEAINSYKEALKIDPTDGDSLYNMGFLYAKMGLLDIAARFYAEALKFNPDDEEARHELKRLLTNNNYGSTRQ